jgi:hypothetical protein
VPRVDPRAACADVERRAWETPNPFERALELLTTPG